MPYLDKHGIGIGSTRGFFKKNGIKRNIDLTILGSGNVYFKVLNGNIATYVVGNTIYAINITTMSIVFTVTLPGNYSPPALFCMVSKDANYIYTQNSAQQVCKIRVSDLAVLWTTTNGAGDGLRNTGAVETDTDIVFVQSSNVYKIKISNGTMINPATSSMSINLRINSYVYDTKNDVIYLGGTNQNMTSEAIVKYKFSDGTSSTIYGANNSKPYYLGIPQLAMFSTYLIIGSNITGGPARVINVSDGADVKTLSPCYTLLVSNDSRFFCGFHDTTMLISAVDSNLNVVNSLTTHSSPSPLFTPHIVTNNAMIGQRYANSNYAISVVRL